MGKAAQKGGSKGKSTPSKKAENDEVVFDDEAEDNGWGYPQAPLVMRFFGWVLRAVILVAIGYEAYDIRLYAIKDYGRVIHEVPSSCPSLCPL